MKNVLMLIIIAVCFTDCDSQSSGDKSKEVNKGIDSSRHNSTNPNNVVVLDDSLLFKYESISKNLYTLRVENYFYNEKANYEDMDLDKVVQKQVLKFSYNDTMLNTFILPVKKINATGKRHKKIQIQENNLYKLCIIDGKVDWLFCVKGGGITDSQTEYYGLFSKQGKLVWYSYTSYQNIHKVQQGIPDEGFGNIDKILSEYGIAEIEFNKPSFCKNISLPQ